MSKKKVKKHRFTHTDPEKAVIAEALPKKGNTKKKAKKELPGELVNIFTDLKGSVVTIALFTTLLIVFYIVNLNYNILEKVKDLLF